MANARGQTGLALALLFAFGLLVGGSVATTVNYYSNTDPTAVRQAFGATALFVAALGCGGYAVRRDLSFLYRTAFLLLLALLGTGIVLIFVQIPAVYTAWSLAGLAIFGLYASSTSIASAGLAPTRQSRGSGDLPRRRQYLPALPSPLRALFLSRKSPHSVSGSNEGLVPAGTEQALVEGRWGESAGGGLVRGGRFLVAGGLRAGARVP